MTNVISHDVSIRFDKYLLMVDFSALPLVRLRDLHALEHGMNAEHVDWKDAAKAVVSSLERFVSNDLMLENLILERFPYTIGFGVGDLDPQDGPRRQEQLRRLHSEVTSFFAKNGFSVRDMNKPQPRSRGNISAIS